RLRRRSSPGRSAPSHGAGSRRRDRRSAYSAPPSPRRRTRAEPSSPADRPAAAATRRHRRPPIDAGQARSAPGSRASRSARFAIGGLLQISYPPVGSPVLTFRAALGGLRTDAWELRVDPPVVNV